MTTDTLRHFVPLFLCPFALISHDLPLPLITLGLVIACGCGPALGALFFVLYQLALAWGRQGWLVTLIWPQEKS